MKVTVMHQKAFQDESNHMVFHDIERVNLDPSENIFHIHSNGEEILTIKNNPYVDITVEEMTVFSGATTTNFAN